MATEPHVALPVLVGAPAYARPRAPIQPAPRPLDLDDMPIEAELTDEERRLMATAGRLTLVPGSYGGHGAAHAALEPNVDALGFLQPRPLRLRSVASRILGDR